MPPTSADDPAHDQRGLQRGPDGLLRCWWAGEDPTYVAYHDTEWGVFDRTDWDERRMFELLTLEAFQSGLAWITILRKRDGFRRAFAGFDPSVVATWGDDERARLLADAAIVRNRAKVDAALSNARATVDLHDRGMRLVDLVFDAAPADALDRPEDRGDVPATTPESTALARTLKAHGFRFVGPTVAYALMQSAGVVDDHVRGCHVPPRTA